MRDADLRTAARAQAGRNGDPRSFVAIVADDKLPFVEPLVNADDSDLLRPLAAVAPLEHAARFTVVTAETLQLGHVDKEAKKQLEKAVRKAHLPAEHGAVRMRNSRLVTLRAECPLVDEHGDVVNPGASETKELQLVAMPLSDGQSRQLFFLDPSEKSWVMAAGHGRGKLQMTSNSKAPSGWEAFNIMNFTTGGKGGGAGAVEEVPSPEIKRQRTIKEESADAPPSWVML